MYRKKTQVIAHRRFILFQEGIESDHVALFHAEGEPVGKLRTKEHQSVTSSTNARIEELYLLQNLRNKNEGSPRWRRERTFIYRRTWLREENELA